VQLLDGKAYQMVKDMHIAQYVLSDEMVAQLLALVSGSPDARLLTHCCTRGTPQEVKIACVDGSFPAVRYFYLPALGLAPSPLSGSQVATCPERADIFKVSEVLMAALTLAPTVLLPWPYSVPFWPSFPNHCTQHVVMQTRVQGTTVTKQYMPWHDVYHKLM
jgi:hypothetical protein